VDKKGITLSIGRCGGIEELFRTSSLFTIRGGGKAALDLNPEAEVDWSKDGVGLSEATSEASGASIETTQTRRR
jgi:hypothetical protein